MKVFDQTVLSDRKAGTHGDCMRACVRTWAQDEMPALPHPVTDAGYNTDFFETLEIDYGWYWHSSRTPHKSVNLSALPRVIMASGPTIRTPETGVWHMVIYDREAERVVHDPHPSRAGLTDVVVFNWLER